MLYYKKICIYEDVKTSNNIGLSYIYFSGIDLIYKVKPENAHGSNSIQIHTVQITSLFFRMSGFLSLIFSAPVSNMGLIHVSSETLKQVNLI